MLNRAALINLLLTGTAITAAVFLFAHRRKINIVKDRVPLITAYVILLILALPAGIFNNLVSLRVMLIVTFIFTMFAIASHYLENKESQFSQLAFEFSNAMIIICLLNMALMVVARL